jgi:hypothetical protein
VRLNAGQVAGVARPCIECLDTVRAVNNRLGEDRRAVGARHMRLDQATTEFRYSEAMRS